MTPEPVRCIVCLGIKRGKAFTRGGGKRTLKGWVCGRCLIMAYPSTEETKDPKCFRCGVHYSGSEEQHIKLCPAKNKK